MENQLKQRDEELAGGSVENDGVSLGGTLEYFGCNVLFYS